MYIQVKALTKLFFRLETRSKDGSFKKLLLIFISFSIPGIFLPLILTKNISDPTGFTFSFISFLFYSMIIAFTIISDLDNIVVTKSEIDLLSVLPVDDSIVVIAKLNVLYRYILIIIIPLLIPGALFFYLQTKSVMFSFLFLFAGYNLCLFIVYIMILLYAIALNNINPLKVSLYTMILQIVFVLIIVLSYQYVTFLFSAYRTGGNNIVLLFFSDPDITKYFPQSWFAFMSVKQNYFYSNKVILKFILPVLVVFLSYISLRVYLQDNYSKIKERLLISAAGNKTANEIVYSGNNEISSGAISRFIDNFYLRNSGERSSFFLMKKLFKHEKSVRMSIISLGLIPVGLTFFAYITNQLLSPFPYSFFDTKPVFHISILLAVLIAVHMCSSGLKTSGFYEATWIYDAIPIGSVKSFKNGMKKFLNIYFIIPVCIILAVIFSFNINYFHSIVHTLYIMQVAVIYNTVLAIFSKKLPFTRENNFLNSIQRITSMIFPLLFGTIFIALLNFSYISVYSALIACLVIFILNFALSRIFLRN